MMADSRDPFGRMSSPNAFNPADAPSPGGFGPAGSHGARPFASPDAPPSVSPALVQAAPTPDPALVRGTPALDPALVRGTPTPDPVGIVGATSSVGLLGRAEPSPIVVVSLPRAVVPSVRNLDVSTVGREGTVALGTVAASVSLNGGTAAAGAVGNGEPTGAVVSMTAGSRDGRPVFDGGAHGPGAWDVAEAVPAGRQDHDLLALGPMGRARVTWSPSSACGEMAGAGTGPLAVLPSRRSDPLTEFDPADRTSLEQAIDQFLYQFADAGSGTSRFRGPAYLLTEVVAVAVALTASKGVVKVLRNTPDDESAWGDEPGADAHEESTGPPDPWSLGPS
jgi:hypothetical protein